MTKASASPGDAKYADRIAKGAALLDEKAPGWRQRINLDQLELSSCTACVLGQVAANKDPWGWYDVRAGFGLNYESAEDHGFSLSDTEYESIEIQIDSDDDAEVYRGLTAEWKQYIEATR